MPKSADLIQITGRDFLREQFLNTPQFYFMGKLDDNDAVPYDDAFDLEERDQIFRLLGEQMMPTRWENVINCTSIFTSIYHYFNVISIEFESLSGN